MPECIDSILKIGQVDASCLSQSVYNVASFRATAGEVAAVLRRSFPDTQIDFVVDEDRQGIVDSWPMDVDCTKAITDWGYKPRWTLEEAFDEYLVPSIRNHYAQA